VGKQNGVATEQVVEDMVARAMELMQLECRSQRRPTRGDYRLDYLNADCDLQALVRKLRSGQNSCAIALYGPPGTGKTGFARYVANALDRPLHDKRASDLLGAFVGETEASIASMFQEAQRDQAVLFIDEVDSFVGERANMHQSWEVTAVNEMLTQIDGFDGLLLCATNRIEQLDMAAMRRFVIKIKFDYLSGAQRRRLFLETVAVDAQEDVVQDCLMRLERMNNITIGDYEVVRQRAQALGATLGPRELITALQAECALKRDQVRQAIGFID
jgi:transitional endoplasmic reticulum ATPase